MACQILTNESQTTKTFCFLLSLMLLVSNGGNGNLNGHVVERILKNIKGPLGLMCGNGLIEDWLRRGGNLKGRAQLWRRRKANVEMASVVLHQIKSNQQTLLYLLLFLLEHAFWLKKKWGNRNV